MEIFISYILGQNLIAWLSLRVRELIQSKIFHSFNKFNPFVTGGSSAARRYVPGEFGLTSAMRRGATRRVTFATARPLYVPGGRGNICPGPATIVVIARWHLPRAGNHSGRRWYAHTLSIFPHIFFLVCCLPMWLVYIIQVIGASFVYKGGELVYILHNVFLCWGIAAFIDDKARTVDCISEVNLYIFCIFSFFPIKSLMVLELSKLVQGTV